jgi:hypothetical protein
VLNILLLAEAVAEAIQQAEAVAQVDTLKELPIFLLVQTM